MKLNARFKPIFWSCILLFGALFALIKPVVIDNDLNDLIATSEHVQIPIKPLMQHYGSFVQVIIETPDFETAQKKATHFYNTLNQTDFDDIQFQITDTDQTQIIQDLSAFKGGLLSLSDRKKLQNNDETDIKNQAVSQLTSSFIPRLLPFAQDPFFLFSNWLMQLLKTDNNWQLTDGFLTQEMGNKHYLLMILKLRPMTAFEMIPIIQKIQITTENLSDKDTRFYLTGSPIHTAQMTLKSQKQINLLSFLSIGMSILFIILLFGRIAYILPIILTIACAFLMGYVSLLLFFPSIHILTFVFGTSLIGLSVDYSFHYLSETENKKQLLQNMRHSFLTTVICFMPLLFASLPVLNQLALFTITGITTVYLSVIWIYPVLRFKTPTPLFPKFTPKPINHKKIIFTLFGLFIAIGLTQFTFKTDMSAIYRPDSALLHNEMLFEKLNGFSQKQFLFVGGRTLEDILQKEEQLDIAGLSQLIPSQQRQVQNQALIQHLFDTQAESLKSDLGLTQTPIYQATPILTEKAFQNSALKRLLTARLFQTDQFLYSITPITHMEMSLEDSSVFTFNPKNYLTDILDGYSHETYRLIFISFIGLFILLSCLYKKRAFLYLIPSITGILFVLATLSYFGISIHFFHLLSLFIVIGIGLDYTIFHINSSATQDLKTVLFSFLTTFFGFGLLSFTSFALIKSLGIVLAVGLGISYLLSLFLFRGTHQ